MPPTRPDQDMSIPASAVFLPSATCSATLPQLMHDGAPLAAENMGRFQVPTLRNVDKRPNPDFVKAYGHNGYFKSLKSIVHFYNTRDVLRRCGTNDAGAGSTRWPAPESADNMNTKFVGRLGLSDEEENALVSFMQTLTDGSMQR